MVQLYTPGHPLDPDRRDGLNGPEFARSITIGDDVWIGGSAIIMGACTMHPHACARACVSCGLTVLSSLTIAEKAATACIAKTANPRAVL